MKTYIVEDDEDMRLILRRLLKRNFPELTEFKESVTAEQALVEVPEYKPDLVLVDISLPGMDGIELINQLKPECRYLCILVVTGHEIKIYEQAAFIAGAHGIVSKSEVTQLLKTIRELINKKKCGSCD